MKQFLIRLLVNEIAPFDCLSVYKRSRLYRMLGLKCVTHHIQSGCYFTFPSQLSNVSIGDTSLINRGVLFDNGEPITIGNRCDIAMNVQILTTTHDIGAPEKRAGWKPVRKPVEIGDGSWICAGVTILPGVKVGSGCVIAAGAVVTEDCEPNWMYGGVPAKKIKELPSLVEAEKQE